jgi:hypothetical protein
LRELTPVNQVVDFTHSPGQTVEPLGYFSRQNISVLRWYTDLLLAKSEWLKPTPVMDFAPPGLPNRVAYDSASVCLRRKAAHSKETQQVKVSFLR